MSENTIILVTVLGVVIMMLLLLGGIAVILFWHQKKVRRFYSEMEEEKAKYKEELLHVQLEVQEHTLAHISREIHDNIGQSLSMAKLNISTIPATADEVTAKKIEDAVGLLTRTMDDLRDLSKSLTLEELKGEGLARAIESQLNHLKKAETHTVVFEVLGTYRYLEDQKEIILFRIFQEALNNVIRHAQATGIVVSLDYKASVVQLKISDNGVGFALPEAGKDDRQPSMGRGLINMKERAGLIQASFRMDSSPGAGSSITVIVPIKTESDHETTD